MPPRQIGRYTIRDPLGSGAMGEVYRAYDPDLGREVALKTVNWLNHLDSDEQLRYFRREVQAAAQLNHPHIVTIHDVGLEHNPPYVVMELLTGRTLKENLTTSPLPWAKALALLRPLVEALAYAHRAGVIHRDVKPANVMFTQNGLEISVPPNIQAAQSEAGHEPPSSEDTANEGWGDLKLVDFGLARQQDDESGSQSGRVIGTPAYMSPEQASGKEIDARSDIFALGIILLEAITGRNPLARDSITQTLLEVASDRPVDLSTLNSNIPTSVRRLIERAVVKIRDQRYPSCEALLADLEQCLTEHTSNGSEATQPSLPVTPPRSQPIIQPAGAIHLTSMEQDVLRLMFSDYRRVAIEAEFNQGLSGSRVFRVRPVDDQNTVHLPTVVKIAPISLIEQEWQAYKEWVENRLPGIARLESRPTLPRGSLWGGLRYALVGGGIFPAQSLRDYYETAQTDHLLGTLRERLFHLMGQNWWLDNRAERLFQMQADYDSLLPVNLVIEPASTSDEANVIDGDHLPVPDVLAGEAVLLKNFVITEINLLQGQLTLNRPPPLDDGFFASYRLRLQNIPDIDRYRVGHLLDSFPGRVKATRQDLLFEQAEQALGGDVDLTTKRLTLPGKVNLPNPLFAYQQLPQTFQTVNISTIHGDLNLENILVDPGVGTREVSLIDFATVRQGHALHDLLRLETEVVTKLIPPILTQANLPLAKTIRTFYEALHTAVISANWSANPRLPHRDLDKPFATLLAIRRMASQCLFNLDDWEEYYRGLMLYLLGALKFKNLDDIAQAKQVAFLAAATSVHLLTWTPEPKGDSPLPLWLIGVIVAITICIGAAGAYSFLSQPNDEIPVTLSQRATQTEAILVATATPTPLPALDPSPTSLTVVEPATSTPTATPEPTQTPTDTPMPSPTPTNTETLIPPTFTPTMTPTPLPPTQTPTLTPTPTPTLPSGLPILLKPLSTNDPSFGETTFEWQWVGDLPSDRGFEVSVWREGEPRAGAHNAVQDNKNNNIENFSTNHYRLTIDISKASGVQGHPGTYLWTVGVVQVTPEYQDLGIQATPGRLRFEAPGGGSSGPEPEPPGGCTHC